MTLEPTKVNSCSSCSAYEFKTQARSLLIKEAALQVVPSICISGWLCRFGQTWESLVHLAGCQGLLKKAGSNPYYKALSFEHPPAITEMPVDEAAPSHSSEPIQVVLATC